MANDRPYGLLASSSGDTPNQWSETVSSIWSGASNFAHEHPILTTTVAVAGTVAAAAAFKGRGGAVLDAVTAKSGTELVESESLLANSRSIMAGSESLLSRSELATKVAASPLESAIAKNIAGSQTPVWVSSPERIISPSGIHIVTADMSSLGAATDAFPHIPKLLVSDPIFRSGGLVTNFEGNLPALYETASNSVVRLQVTRADGAATLLKTGSGYFNHEGEIVTAHHVIRGGEEIHVFGKPFEEPLRAIVKSADPEHDLAVLRLVDPVPSILKNVRPFGYRPASELLQPAEQVIGFGYPNGVETLTAMPGNFSNWKNIQLGVSSEMTGNAMRTFMETAPGASGGVMVDRQGRIFGTIVQMNKADHVGWSVPYPTMRGF